MNHPSDHSLWNIEHTHPQRSFVLMGLGAVIGLAVAGYGLFTAGGPVTNQVPPEYVALVNQRPIYRSDYLLQLKSLFDVDYSQATAAQRQQVLDDMINEELLVQRGLAADLPAYDPDVRSALVAGVELQMYADVLASQPSEAELLRWYEQHRDKYSSLTQLQLRDLVLSPRSGEDDAATQARASQAVAALRAGKTVDAVMQQFGLRDSLHLQQGGKADLGDIFEFAAEANLPAAVFKVVKTLPAGQVADPIQVPDEGWHVVLVSKRIDAQAQPFAAVRARVWTDIKNEEQARVRNTTLSYLRSKADILVGKE